MAKKSVIARNEKRIKLVATFIDLESSKSTAMAIGVLKSSSIASEKR